MSGTLSLRHRISLLFIRSPQMYWVVRSIGSPRVTVRVLRKWREDAHVLPLTRDLWWEYLGIHLLMERHVGRFPNLIEPKGFSDKVQWVKLFDRNPVRAVFCDKLAVRAWISEHIGERYAAPIRTSFARTEDIPEEVLSRPYVIKASHDSGSTVIVRDPSPESNRAAIRAVRRAASFPYGVRSAEWGYVRTVPRIIIEDILEGADGGELADYRFHCSRGEVLWVQVNWTRDGGRVEQTFEPDGSPTGIVFSEHNAQATGADIPEDWEAMKRLASEVSREMNYLRVDLYADQGEIFIGELTNWPHSGNFTGEGAEELGRRLRLPELPQH